MGDILQELNCVLKYGGYTTRNSSIYDPAKNIIQYDLEGDAKRLMFSNDRPSATRILWYLYNGRNLGRNCKDDRIDETNYNGESSDWTQCVNQFACGGFYHEVPDRKTQTMTVTGFMYDPSKA